MSFIHPDVNMVTRPNASAITDYNGNAANAVGTPRNNDDGESYSDASAREAADPFDNMPKRKSEKIEIKIVLVKLQAESPLLPTNNKDNTNTKPEETNNNNSNNNGQSNGDNRSGNSMDTMSNNYHNNNNNNHIICNHKSYIMIIWFLTTTTYMVDHNHNMHHLTSIRRHHNI
uniref:Uncharacterized protein n=1 Tax=Zeugodacus cucurbitae TaxID=28588 RepID=A0A0A1X5L1_ZEUCU